MTTITNDQITAGAAVLCDHGQPIGRNAAIVVFDAMRAASPQVADIAELSKGEIDAIVYLCRQQGNDTTYDIVNAAIAASRRAAGGDGRLNEALSVCGTIAASDIGAEGTRAALDCISGIRDLMAAPASAGQASPYHACLSVACSFEHDSVERHAAMSCVRAVQAALATQPAEGAGQAGQGAKVEPTKMCRKKDGCEDMWKCSSARVGDCGAQDQIIERAAAPADHKIREAVNQLRDVAVQFQAHQSLRDRIAAVVLPLLKARAAATSAGEQ